jgi:hypothetical protein
MWHNVVWIGGIWVVGSIIAWLIVRRTAPRDDSKCRSSQVTTCIGHIWGVTSPAGSCIRPDIAKPSPSRPKGRLLCGAKTRAGGCCQVRAEPGKARCRFRSGKSTGPNTQAGRARIAEAQRLRWRCVPAGPWPLGRDPRWPLSFSGVPANRRKPLCSESTKPRP